MDTKEILINIGLKIRELREKNNLTIQALSDKLDIEYNNLIRIEKGRTNFTIGTLFKISQALDVKLIEIIDVE
jgi:transcriptional regulator with XRE-family HTH domain